MARLLFLGRLEDLAGAGEREWALAEPTPLADVVMMLPPALAEALREPKVRVAVNGMLVEAAGLIVAADDEVAFLPPVSGG